MGFFSKLFKKKSKENIQEQKAVETPKGNKASEPAPAPKKPKSDTQKAAPAKPKVESTKATPTPSETPKASDTKVSEKKEEAIQKNRQTGNYGFFEIKKSKDDRYVFNLYAPNRVIVATSQVYSSPQSALNGINSVIANAETANIEDQTAKDFEEQNYPKWEIYKDKGGDFRFRLSASNGSCICHSQGYTSKASCKNGIESIIKNAKTAKIEKSYLKKDT